MFTINMTKARGTCNMIRFGIFITTIFLLSSIGVACINNSDNGGTNDIERDPCQGMPMGRILFPQDEYPHDDPVEWYYWTGHLQTKDGRWFGYEMVCFLLDLREQLPEISTPLIRDIVDRFGGEMLFLNLALTDVHRGNFHYTFGFAPKTAPRLGEPLRFEVDGASALLDQGSDVLRGEADDYAIHLTLESIKAPVLQHGDGYHEYSFGGYTYYYSRERIDTSGTITIEGKPYGVGGTSWFDHQWGQLEDMIDVGWDWFAIQLEDNREIMLFAVKAEDQTVVLGGSLTASDCLTREILPEELEIIQLGTWTSPHTNKTYPMGWSIRLDGINLTLTPLMEDQELVTPFKTYWEGACEVTGDVTGRAYVELTGY